MDVVLTAAMEWVACVIVVALGLLLERAWRRSWRAATSAVDQAWRDHHPRVKPLRDLAWRLMLRGWPRIGGFLLSVAFVLARIPRR